MLLLDSRDPIARVFVYFVVCSSLAMTWRLVPKWVPSFRFGDVYDVGTNKWIGPKHFKNQKTLQIFSFFPWPCDHLGVFFEFSGLAGISVYLLIVLAWSRRHVLRLWCEISFVVKIADVLPSRFYMQQPVVALAPLFFADPVPCQGC